MADWRDVMHARSKADVARATLDALGESMAGEPEYAAAVTAAAAALAITAELRALGTVIDYTAREYAPLSPL